MLVLPTALNSSAVKAALVMMPIATRKISLVLIVTRERA